MSGLRSRWLLWRNRRLSNPRFQRWATRFLPTRGIARADTRRLFDICAGFVYSQVLAACIELDLFELLARCPCSVEEIARHGQLPVDGAQRLIDAAESLDLFQKAAPGRYTLGRLGAAVVGNPAIRAMVRHHGALYRDLADPVARLTDRSAPSALRRYWAYADTNDRPLESADTAPYTTLMAESQAMIAEQVLYACDLSKQRHLLDIGGGAGVFAEAVSRRYPHLALSILDLPSVAETARERFAAMAPPMPICCYGGDMFAGCWPTSRQEGQGHGEGNPIDTISFVRILHDHDDGPVAAVLERAYAALPAGGMLIVAEPMADTPGAEPIGAAYFGLYLWTMGQGRPRTAATLRAMLHTAGFINIRQLVTPNPLLASVLVARRAAAIDGH